MRKTFLIAFLVSAFFTFAGDSSGQHIYKWVDEKGTIHFSDNPTSSVFNKEKEAPKENGIEVLKKIEIGNRPQEISSGGKGIHLGYSSGSGSGGSIGGKTTTIRTGRT